MPPRKYSRRRAKTPTRRSVASRKTKRAKSAGWQLGAQLAIAVSAMAVLALLGFVDRSIFSAALGTAKVPTTVAIDIGIEHAQPTDMTMLVARKGPLGYIELNNTSNFPLSISLPETWERSEVSGGSMWLVTQKDPEFGFVRWTIPAHMGMTMHAPQVPDEITFHSPSGFTASIRITSVDVQDSTRNERTLLFQNVTQVKLWVSEEE